MPGLMDLNILVVNGNTNHIRLLRTVLKAFGLGRVDEARSLTEGRGKIKMASFDLVIIDMYVGNENGLSFIQWMRGVDGRGPAAYTPVIVASAMADKDMVIAAIAAGADEFVTLPLSPKTMLEHIEKIIFRPHPHINAPGYYGPCRRRNVDPSYAGEERRMSGKAAGGETKAAG
jgi:DNA-binding response OmpR family regulator